MNDKPDLEKTKMNIPASIADPGTVANRKRNPALAPEIQAQIGRKLMAVYDDVLQQPIPDRFKMLLDQLDGKAAKPGSKGGGE